MRLATGPWWRHAGEVGAEVPDEAGADLFDLGERCAYAYRRAEALHYEALRLLAEFDRLGGYEDAGFPSAADWLAWRVGIKIGPARERVRTARALVKLPKTAAAMRDGGLSFAKVRALTRIASPENEGTLLEFARAGSAANLERMVRGWKDLNRDEEISAEQARFRCRRLSAFVDDDGTVVVRGRLDPETGAQLMRAIDAASDALFRADDDRDEVTPEQRRADALGLLAERALAAGFGAAAPVSGQRASRTEVVLHVEASTLGETTEPGLSELEDGTRVSAETSRRVACDTGVVEVRTDGDGRITNLGRRRRTVPPALRRALEIRDRGCRFPGCGLRFTDAHHVRHWADGGETRLGNLVLLCRRHHRAVHEGGMRVCLGTEAEVVFFDRKGRAACAEPAPRRRQEERLTAGGRTVEQPSERPLASERSVSGSMDEPLLGQPAPAPSLDLSPNHKRDADIPWAVEAAAWDALDPAEPVGEAR